MARKQKFDYFDAFSRQTKVAIKESELLVEAVRDFGPEIDIGNYARRSSEIEHAGDGIAHEIYENVAVDFVTPIEREDIIMLTQYLDDIVDHMQDTLKAFYMFNVTSMDKDVEQFVTIINQACCALDRAMADFNDFKKKRFRELIIEVNDYEEQGDLLYMKALRRLHKKHADDPIYVIAWMEIYKNLERCCDSCEHVADTMMTVILKNS